MLLPLLTIRSFPGAVHTAAVTSHGDISIRVNSKEELYGLVFVALAAIVSPLNSKLMAGYHQYQSCIEACLRCAAICNHCASSCLQEEDVKMMARCIQLDMECAALCYTAAQLMSMGSQKAMEICRICADLCEECGAECAKHKMEHCQECAEICRRCAEECRAMAGATA